ncbi:MAG: SLAC1 anion channel family protein [Pseudomonadota bacterium]
MSEQTARLQNFPVSWFSIIMGLVGFTIAWAKAESVFGLGVHVSGGLLDLSIVLAAAIAVLYLAKLIRYPDEVKAEVQHPVKLAFVPTISIALILLGIATLHGAPQASFWLWSVGTVLQLALTLYVLSSWIHHDKYDIQHLNPAWFIPVVGNILVPIAGVHHAPAEISWFFLSTGLFFWPVLTAILFYRLIFHASLPAKLVPTLFIVIAPPAVGFIAYLALHGSIDVLAMMLYYVGLFFTLVIATQIVYFTRLKFFLSWWAYSFPVAAITIATLAMAEHTGIAFFFTLATVLLAILSFIIAGLLVRTLIAIYRREICVEGH